MECAHLKLAVSLLEKYEKTSHEKVFGDGEFPELLKIGSHKDYIREVLETTITMTAKNRGYEDVAKLKDNDRYFAYQKAVVGMDENMVPSHEVISKAIEVLGQDYRYQDSKHPVLELQDRKKDNVNITRKK